MRWPGQLSPGPFGALSVLSRRVLFALGVGGLMSGCVALDPAVQQSAQALWPWADAQGGGAGQAPRLNPDFDYLRVVVSGQVLYLARGYTDTADTANNGGPVTVWYSADREVLRLQHGRLAGLAGTPVAWLHVRGLAGAPITAPDDAPNASPQAWVREIDQMPGYRWGVRDRLVVRPIEAPANSQVHGWLPQALRWAQEQDEAGRLPPARYAWAPGQPEPIYGEQCLQPDFCLTWQRWSAQGAVPTPP